MLCYWLKNNLKKNTIQGKKPQKKLLIIIVKNVISIFAILYISPSF